jgi:hypothetical protein
MKPVFCGTFFFLAAINQSDARNCAAESHFKHGWTRINTDGEIRISRIITN